MKGQHSKSEIRTDSQKRRLCFVPQKKDMHLLQNLHHHPHQSRTNFPAQLPIDFPYPEKAEKVGWKTCWFLLPKPKVIPPIPVHSHICLWPCLRPVPYKIPGRGQPHTFSTTHYFLISVLPLYNICKLVTNPISWPENKRRSKWMELEPLPIWVSIQVMTCGLLWWNSIHSRLTFSSFLIQKTGGES